MVSITTILHHIQQPWLFEPSADNYYFCESAACQVVYFGNDDTVIDYVRLRSVIAAKERSAEALICHCYGVTRVASLDPQIRAYVVAQTQAGPCACETRNPSGRCCLKDFPKG